MRLLPDWKLNRWLIIPLVLLLGVVSWLVFNLYGLNKLTNKGEEPSTSDYPVPKKYYSRAEPIYREDGSYVGLGFKLPAGTSFSAIFDGWLEAGGVMGSVSSSESFPVWSLGEINREYKAEYIFVKDDEDWVPAREVKKGEILGKVGEGNIEPYEANLIIKVRESWDREGEIVELVSEKDWLLE